MSDEGYFKRRRELKRQIVRMNAPWSDRIKDWLFLRTLQLLALAAVVLIIRAKLNGAW